MTIDYDRMRELVGEMEQGVAATTRYTWLDLAHELLRLRDGLDDLLSVMAYDGERLHKDHYPLTRKYLATYADKLDHLLDGDTE